MDCLPISIQRIVWYDYVDFDYEDLITPETQVTHYLEFRSIIPDEDKHRDDFNVFKVACGKHMLVFVHVLQRNVVAIDAETPIYVTDMLIDYLIKFDELNILKSVLPQLSENDAMYEYYMRKLEIALVMTHMVIVDFIYDRVKDNPEFKNNIKKLIREVLYECERPKVKTIKEWYKKISA